MFDKKMKKNNFDTIKKGYLFLPNFFNEYEIESLKKSIEIKKKNNENFNDFKEESLWDFVTNQRVIEKVKIYSPFFVMIFVVDCNHTSRIILISIFEINNDS